MPRMSRFGREALARTYDDFRSAIRGIAFVSLKLIYLTPVKTGHARGNWNYTINGVDNTVRDIYDRTGDATAADARNQVIFRLKPGDRFSAVNGVHYMTLLNNAHSIQNTEIDWIGRVVADMQALMDERLDPQSRYARAERIVAEARASASQSTIRVTDPDALRPRGG